MDVKKNIYTRLIIGAALLLLIVAFAQLNLFNLLDSYQMSKNAAYAEYVQNQLSQFINFSMKELSIVAEDQVVQATVFQFSIGDPPANLHEQVRHYQVMYPNILKIAVYNDVFTNIFSSEYRSLESQKADLFKKLMILNGADYYFSDAYYSDVFNRYIFSLYRRLGNPLLQPIGYVQADINIDDFYTNMRGWKRGYFLALGGDAINYVYPHVDAAGWPNDRLLRDERFAGGAVASWAGKRYNIYRIDVPETGWKIIFGIPQYYYRNSALTVILYVIAALLILGSLLQLVLLRINDSVAREQKALDELRNRLLDMTQDTQRAGIQAQEMSEAVSAKIAELQTIVDKKQFAAPRVIEREVARESQPAAPPREKKQPKKFRLITGD